MEYYSLVAGFVEYALDSEPKSFNARSIINETLEELTAADAATVRLLYTYYDCLNLAALRAGRSAYNVLGNISQEELEGVLSSGEGLPERLSQVVRAYSNNDSDSFSDVDTNLSFEVSLFGAYYAECEASKVEYLREWSKTDCNIRNVVTAITARERDIALETVLVGGNDIAEQLQRSSAADFGLRGELGYLDSLIAAVADRSNLVEMESRIDAIKWDESLELATFDYFSIGAVLSYLVRINIVSRWCELDVQKGREMFERLLGELKGDNPKNEENK